MLGRLGLIQTLEAEGGSGMPQSEAKNLALDETDPFQPTQVIVARVEMSPVMPGCCVDQGVSKMKTVLEATIGSFEA